MILPVVSKSTNFVTESIETNYFQNMLPRRILGRIVGQGWCASGETLVIRLLGHLALAPRVWVTAASFDPVLDHISEFTIARAFQIHHFQVQNDWHKPSSGRTNFPYVPQWPLRPHSGTWPNFETYQIQAPHMDIDEKLRSAPYRLAQGSISLVENCLLWHKACYVSHQLMFQFDPALLAFTR